jgi:hypothetical protein
VTLERFDRDQRKEIVKAAVRLHKSGAEPAVPGVPDRPSRSQRRQAARALGWRGSKASRHNIVREVDRVRRVVAVDEALVAAKDRVEHPVRSRLRRG